MDDEKTEIINVLRRAGLSEVHATAYLTLVEKGAMTPTTLAESLGVARTNGYMIADRLASLGLAKKDESQKKITFSPIHPSSIESLVERRRKSMEQNERIVRHSIPTLINYFSRYQTTPNVVTYFGQEGDAKLRQEILDTREPLYYLQSPYSTKENEFLDHCERQGIKTEGITPLPDDGTYLDKTHISPKSYDSTVEINIFGNKVAFVDYNDEGMDTLIESRNIASAMRQLFHLAKTKK